VKARSEENLQDVSVVDLKLLSVKERVVRLLSDGSDEVVLVGDVDG
jgi:hypothetical protein